MPNKKTRNFGYKYYPNLEIVAKMLNEEKYNLETKWMDLGEHSNSSVLLTNVGGSSISPEYSLSYCSESMGAFGCGICIFLLFYRIIGLGFSNDCSHYFTLFCCFWSNFYHIQIHFLVNLRRIYTLFFLYSLIFATDTTKYLHFWSHCS